MSWASCPVLHGYPSAANRLATATKRSLFGAIFKFTNVVVEVPLKTQPTVCQEYALCWDSPCKPWNLSLIVFTCFSVDITLLILHVFRPKQTRLYRLCSQDNNQINSGKYLMCDKYLLLGMFRVRRWTKQAPVFPEMVIMYFAWSVTVSCWPTPHNPCTILEADWRAGFLWDLIINYSLSVNLLPEFWFHGSHCPHWLIGCCCGWLSVASVFSATSCLLRKDFSQMLTAHLCQSDGGRSFKAVGHTFSLSWIHIYHIKKKHMDVKS